MNSENMLDQQDMEDEGFVVRIRGLPWSASQDEVAKFLEGCDVIGGKEGIHFTYVRDGRPSGEAYIELSNEEDLEKALSKNKQHMGRRYIEVFRSKRSEMEWVVKRSGPEQVKDSTDAVVRLRGLPFGCSKEEIAHFFTGLEIVPNGITLIHDAQGRTTGDAYCQFASMDIAEQAMSKHKERIGHRYIEIFKSSMMEARNAINQANRGGGMGMGPRPSGMGMNRPGPYDRSERFGGGMGMGGFRGRGRANIKGYYDDGYYDDEYEFGGGYGGRGGMGGRRGGMGWGRGGRGGSFGGMGRGGGGSRGGSSMSEGNSDYDSQTGHCVHMRGLPFAATEQDILDFFKPMNPVNVVIHYNSDGRASGEADVDFATHEEAKEAMHKDRATMQHRYIELFQKSTPAGRQGGSGFGASAGGYDSNAMGGGSFGNGVGANNPNYTAF